MVSQIIKGIPASQGIAIGKVFLYKPENISLIKKTDFTKEHEKERLLSARELSKAQLIKIRNLSSSKITEKNLKIFDAHITILNDEELLSDILKLINTENSTAEYAVNHVINGYIEIFKTLDNEYMVERASDLQDISKRWLLNLLEIEIKNLSNLPENTIIVAKDLSPSDTAQLDLNNTLGFITEFGGKTSHSVIMAKTLEIPAIVGIGSDASFINEGSNIILDGLEGKVIIDPDECTLNLYKSKQNDLILKKQELGKIKDTKAISKDGIEIKILGNIGSPTDLKNVLQNGGQGIGLYRTEFLFMSKDRMPTEDEQFEAYKKVAEAKSNFPITVRTMDIGGDKEVSCLNLPEEQNPFLGWRAIRICLERPDILKTQFKALLRASIFGKIKIMIPMITAIEEIKATKEILNICKEELSVDKIAFDENIELGIMVETPAVVMRIDDFAKEVDFFSIGSNDLTQYILAADRVNDKVSHLYNHLHPSVLSAIKYVIDSANSHGIEISVCGEIAGDENATAILFAMGLRFFSVSANSILKIKQIILNLKREETEKLLENVMNLSLQEDIKKTIEEFMLKIK